MQVQLDTLTASIAKLTLQVEQQRQVVQTETIEKPDKLQKSLYMRNSSNYPRKDDKCHVTDGLHALGVLKRTNSSYGV